MGPGGKAHITPGYYCNSVRVEGWRTMRSLPVLEEKEEPAAKSVVRRIILGEKVERVETTVLSVTAMTLRD